MKNQTVFMIVVKGTYGHGGRDTRTLFSTREKAQEWIDMQYAERAKRGYCVGYTPVTYNIVEIEVQ